LAGWLLAPAGAGEIRGRQAAARDLRNRLDLREAWAILGDDDDVGVHPEALRDWAETPNRLEQKWSAYAAWGVPLLVAGALATWSITGIASPTVLALLAAVVLSRSVRAPVHEVLHG